MSDASQAAHEDRKRSDPRTTEQLISVALTELDEHVAWDAICTLHFRGTSQVLHRASELCRSANPVERRLGADILGQLGVPDRTFPGECLAILVGMMSSEDDPEVLRAIFIALGHQGQPEAIEPALTYRQHSDPQVRNAVVFALTGHDDPRAIKGLIELSRDDDTDVRDWATFGLGSQTDLDTPVLREALVERLTDSDQETRGEAMVGLAKRKDLRVIPAICKELASPNVGYHVFQAAQMVASSELLPQLLVWRDQHGVTDDQLADAIAACSPSMDAEKPDVQPWKQ